ncbi:MAG TPA: hypothetical protein VNT75_33320 [Symbiobacteriaceae bacterium]|nr:hypothetical protein [Symbiobacteriaceae bacterium]
MAMPAGYYSQFSSLSEQLQGLLKAREHLDRQIERVERELEALKTPDEPDQHDGPPLRGLKVAVVGPSFRESLYRQELGLLGATVLFASSENKLGRVAQVCGKAHGIIYITSFTGHDAHDHVMAAARRRGVPLVRLPFTGIERLKQAAIDLGPDMALFKEIF